MEPMTIQPLDWDGYTIADLEAMPDDDDGLHYELDDGCLVVSPSPPNSHNIAATHLAYLILSELGGDWRVAAAGAVLFDARNYREPDLVVIRREGARTAYADPSDVLLAVEVMSPSSIRRDRLVKPAQYAAAGIKHFWRLEPVDRVLVTYVLEGKTYRETGRFLDEVVIDEPVGLRFRLADLLD
jgi:Uma2 family endonuclease